MREKKLSDKIYNYVFAFFVIGIISTSVVLCFVGDDKAIVNAKANKPETTTHKQNQKTQLTESTETLARPVSQRPTKTIKKKKKKQEKTYPHKGTYKGFDVVWLSKYVFEIEVIARAYCPCRRCCGKWAKHKRYANGERVSYSHYGVAADTNIFPFGTLMRIDGYTVTTKWAKVRDRGPYCRGRKLEVFMTSTKNGKSPHRRAKIWGVKRMKIKVKLPKWALEEMEDETCQKRNL